MSNYCPLPFGHMAVDTKGDYKPCCQHQPPTDQIRNIRSTSHEQWFNGQYMADLRQVFLTDQRHPGCAKCWNFEDAGQTSLRQRVSTEYQILKTGIDPNLVNLELQLGNLCNLKCLMCDEASSSAILSENRKLGINRFEQKDFTWDEQAWINLESLVGSGLKVLNIRGGEPFYNKGLLDIIERMSDDRCRNLVLHITTNGTIWSERWQQALSRFRLVRIMFSVDAVGDLYEYIRYPASWQTVEQNIDQIRSCANVNAMVHAVVQNLNAHALADLITWCDQRSMFLEFESLVKPAYLSFTNLPLNLKQRAESHLTTCLTLTQNLELKKNLSSYVQQLQSSEFDSDLWNSFLAQITIRDRIRNNDFSIFLPTEGSI